MNLPLCPQFENLLLLSEGRMVYFGKADASIDYFATRSFSCPEHFNPGQSEDITMK